MADPSSSLRFVNVDELLTKVFTHIAIFPVNERRQTLVALIRACKLFNEKASDLLWESMDSFKPLVQLLPVSSKTTVNPYIGVFSRVLRPEDWETFKKYARRVRALIITSWDAWLSSAIKHMVLFSQGPYSVVSQGHGTVQGIGSIPCFFPHLEELTWLINDTEGNDSVVKSVLSYVHPRSAVKELCLPGPYSQPRFIEQSITHIVGTDFQALQSLCLGDGWAASESPLMESVAQFPALRLLDLGTVESPLPSSAGFASHLCQQGFRSLREIHLTASALVIGLVLQYLGGATLEIISATLPANDNDFGHIFTSASARHAHSLKELTIKGGASTECVGVDTSQLLTFTKLHSLNISISGPLRLTDELLEDLATTFSELRSLLLSPRPSTQSGVTNFRPGVTVRGLKDLLATCSHLQSLGIVIDATDTAGLMDMWKPASHVYELDLGASRLDDPTTMAAIFSGMFPRLEKLTWASDKKDFGYSRKYSAHWDTLWNRSLPVLRHVREEERRNTSRRG